MKITINIDGKPARHFKSACKHYRTTPEKLLARSAEKLTREYYGEIADEVLGPIKDPDPIMTDADY
jgi:hypothetical protein